MYIGIEVYDSNIIEKICENSKIDGVVIGDLYCQKRMFENGVYDMFAYIDTLKNAGKKVIFQTPRYITDRNMAEEIEKVRFLVSKKNVDAVIVHDIGVASEIFDCFPEIELIWGRMGYNRNPVANKSFFEFLKKYHVVSVETADPNRKRVFEAMGLKVYSIVGELKYQTVNRECYFLFQNDIFDNKCDRGCLKRQQEMVQKNGNVRMTVDGYMMGCKYDYSLLPETKEQWADSIIYGKSYDSILEWVEMA